MKCLLLSIGMAAIIISSVAQAGTINDPYGICALINRQPELKMASSEFKLIHDTGIEWVRTDIMWHRVEPVAGKWDFSAEDEMMEHARASRIHILPVLGYNSRDVSAFPAWKNLDRWSSYVREVVKRYGRDMPFWEVWNEPNDPHFWGAPVKDSPADAAQYAMLLKRTYDEIKSIDSNLKILYGGTSRVPLEFIEKSFAAGAGNSFDVMSVHPYNMQGKPEDGLISEMRNLFALMEKYKVNKPVWITEIGWSTAAPLLRDVLPVAFKRAGIKPEESTAAIVCSPEPAFWGAENLISLLDHFRSVEKITFDQLKNIDPQKYSLLIPAGGERFPAQYIPELVKYVEKGGTLLLPTSLPFYYDLAPDQDGKLSLRQVADKYMADFHIGWDTWWTSENVPKNPTFVKPAQEFEGQFKVDMDILPAGHFLSARNLKGNDQFLPIVEAGTDRFTAAVAGIYKLDSDLKGNVIICVAKAPMNTVPESIQAEFLPRTYLIALACGVDRIFWYNFRSGEWKATDKEAYFGIVRENLVPKPSYRAMKILTSLCPSGSTRPELKSNGNLFLASWTRPDGVNVWAYWTAHRSENVGIQIKGSVQRIVNHLGEPLGRAECTATGSICYVVGPESVSFGNVFTQEP